MNTKINEFEVMAPVGSRESLAAAIQAGADSVYFGIGKLNMRSHSANHFTIDDLREIAATCNEHGIKTYLTVNTVIYDDDIETMKEIIDAAKEAGISAVIASDVAVMSYCNEVGEEVHLSTQLNISNTEALKFYARFADVSVLARELNMDQVKHIHEQIEKQNICGPMGKQIRIEMFCHGALCMAVSGKCYMSLANANRSANRGECVQICRRSYTVTDNETGNQLEIDNKYVMSPKDLKTIRFIDRMMDAGVRVFKIEGRARELSLDEIREIHKKNPSTQLEVFVHGALCVSYSGVSHLVARTVVLILRISEIATSRHAIAVSSIELALPEVRR